MNICFLDFETSGIDVFKDYPIEIGAVLVDSDLRVLETFASKIKPRTKRSISSKAMEIHGQEYQDLSEAPSQDEVIRRFFDKMGTNFRFACWNMNFDVTFFRRMCHLNNFMSEYNSIYYRHLDIQSISTYLQEKELLKVEKVSLDSLCDLFNIERKSAHSAVEDAKITLEVYKQLVRIPIGDKL